MQVFDITVPVGQAFTVSAAGRYIKYMAGSNGGADASISLTPGHQGGMKITLQPGQAYRVSADSPVPDSWTIANYAGVAAIVGKVVVGNGQIDDSTVSGVVQVVDGGKARTLAGIACAGYTAASAVAAQYAQLQLWNPAASGKRLIVEGVTLIAANAAQAALLVFNNVVLPNNSAGYSKLTSGPAPVAVPQWGTTAAAAAALALFATSAPVNTSPAFKLNEPIVVRAGYSLMMYSTVPNAYMGATFEWYEESDV